MTKKKSLIIYFIILQFFFCGLLLGTLNYKTVSSSSYDYYNLKSSMGDFSNAIVISDGYNGVYWNDGNSYETAIAVDSSDRVHAVWADETDGVWGTDVEIMYASFTTATGWSNVTIISDGYDGVYWNDQSSYNPAIAVDSSDRVHVVWQDNTNGAWGADSEIMYVNFTTATGWSNVVVISDGYDGIYWNNGGSYAPAIAVDSSDRVHVVWHDYTDGVWGADTEIMYVNFTTATGWSNVVVISDGYDGTYWNYGHSFSPAITVDSSDRVHVVWYDETDGAWGTDREIMYANFTTAIGWSNITVVSDGYDGTYWNDGSSYGTAIAVDSSDRVHVVWMDETDGVWGTDIEILYANFTTATGWSNVTVVSDGYDGTYWNHGNSHYPAITVNSSNAVHVVWHDDTNGVWGGDQEIMHASFTNAIGWSNVTVISDGYEGTYWNNHNSRSPAITVDNSDGFHVVWADDTNGVWGGDREIMYVNFAMPTPPLNPSIIINNGDASTNSTLVNLTLSADGAEEMCFRNGTTGAWSGWEAYATAKQLYLEGSINNTEYSIYVKFRNATGESAPIGDSILYLIMEEVEEEIPLGIPGYPVGLIIILLLGEIGIIMILNKSKRIKLIK